MSIADWVAIAVEEIVLVYLISKEKVDLIFIFLLVVV